MTENENKQIDALKREVITKVSKVPSLAMAHGYLWGYVTIRTKKNTKNYKVLFGGVCGDFDAIIKLANSVPDVYSTYINVD